MRCEALADRERLRVIQLVPTEGLEPGPTANKRENHGGSAIDVASQAPDADANSANLTGRSIESDHGNEGVDPVEHALAEALQRAALAGEWEAVSSLTAELRARRDARAGVVNLDAERAKREGKR